MAKTNYLTKKDDIMDAALRRCTAKFKDIGVGIQTVGEFMRSKCEPTKPIRKTDKYVVTTYVYGKNGKDPYDKYEFTGRGKNVEDAAYESLREAEKGIIHGWATTRMVTHVAEFLKLFDWLMGANKSVVVYTVTKVDTEFPREYVHREFPTRKKAASFIKDDYNIVREEESLNDGMPADLDECMGGLVYHTDERTIRYILHPVVVFEDDMQ